MFTDGGFVMDALGKRDDPFEQFIENRSGRFCVLGDEKGVPHLTEDLRFSQKPSIGALPRLGTNVQQLLHLL